MFNPFDYGNKTQETMLLGIAHYDYLMDWCNGDPSNAYHLLKVFFDRDEVLEKVISKSAYCSYKYAKDILNLPFVLGEEAILNSEYKDEYLALVKQKHV